MTLAYADTRWGAERAPSLSSLGTRRLTVPAESDSVLAIENLVVRRGDTRLVDGVSLTVRAGETLCLVGESGCGKSLTCMAAMGLTAAPLTAGGSIRLFGHQMLDRPERALNALRGREAAMIFQSPMISLNPIQRIGDQIEETLALHTDLSRRARREEVVALLDRVGIQDPARHAKAYPSQLSGGMCQRAMIAMAIACRPRLLIADEPTTALDVTIQAQVLGLLRQLQRETGMAIVFVTHDLGVVAEMADRVAVMYSGRIVEEGSADEIFEAPAHPYTRALMGCRIDAQGSAERTLATIAGSVPSPSSRPSGCAFAPRCAEAHEACRVLPELRSHGSGLARVACHAGGVGH